MGILSYFFAKDNPAKLLELYKTTNDQDEKLKICNRLIELGAVAINELWQMKSKNQKLIYPFLIDHYTKDKVRLLELHKTSSNKQEKDKIISSLIALKAINELWLIRDDCPETIYQYLITVNKTDTAKLLELYKTAKANFKTQIVDILTLNNASNELWQLKDDYPEKVYPYLQKIYNNNNDKLNELYKNMDPVQSFLNRSQYCSNEEYFADYYKLLNFIFIDHFLDNYYFYLISIKDYYTSVNDCVSENLTDYVPLFEKFFNLGLETLNTNTLIMSYLINNRAYKTKLDELKKTKIVTANINKSTEDIKTKFVNLKKNATTRAEIDQHLAQEKAEIDKLFLQSTYDLLESVIKPKLTIKNPQIFSHDLTIPKVIGQTIDLIQITQNHRITPRYADDCKQIETDLEKQLYQLTDSDSIMKAKAQAKQKQSMLIAKNDFNYTLQNADPTLADNPQIMENVGNILVHYNDLNTKKVILNFAAISSNRKWLKAVLNVANKNTDKELKAYILNCLLNKISAWNLKYMTSLVNSVPDFKEIHSHQHGGYVQSVAFSPDGSWLASGGCYDKTVKIVRLADFKVVHSYCHWDDNSVNCIAFSPDGKLLASASSKTVKILRLADFKEIYSSKRNDSFHSVAFSPDGKLLASGGSYCDVKIVQLSDFKEVHSYKHGYNVQSVAFSPDGNLLASGGDDRTVKIKRLSDFKEVHSYKYGYNILNVAFSQDSNLLAISGGDNSIKIVRLLDSKEVHNYWHANSANCLAFSPDGKLIASGGNDKVVKIVRLADFKEIHNYRHGYDIHSVAFSQDGNCLAIGNGDNTVKIGQIIDNHAISAKLLFDHLIYLYYNARDADIRSLIEYKNSINTFTNLTTEQKSALLSLVEEIIEKAGRKSKSPTLATGVNVKSKDIEIVY